MVIHKGIIRWSFLLLFIANSLFVAGAFITDKIKLKFSQKPIRQVLFKDKSGFIAMGGNQAFTYYMNKEINEYSKMNKKPYLTTAFSSILKRLENENIAIICGNKLIMTFNDDGVESSNYDVVNSYMKDYQCSLTEIKQDVFLISSLISSTYKIPTPTIKCPIWKYYDYYSKTCKSCPDGEYYEANTKECKTCTAGQHYDYSLKQCLECVCQSGEPCSYDSSCSPPQCKVVTKLCATSNVIAEEPTCKGLGYLLQVIEYQNSNYVSTFSHKICPSGSKYQINCESFLKDQKYFCAYLSDGLKGKIFSNKLVASTDEISFAGSDYYYSKLFCFNENTLVIFYMNENQLYGQILIYENSSVTQRDSKAIVIEGRTFSFKSTDIAKITDDMLLAFLLSNTYIFIRKFYKSLEPNGPLIKIQSGTSNLQQASIGGGMSEIEYGLLFADTSRNYIILVEFPKCKDVTYSLINGINQSLEDTTESGTVEYEKIMFTNSDPARITTTIQDIRLNKLYDLNKIEIGFKEGGVYQYSFITMITKNKIDIHSSDCKITFNVCYPSCKTCIVIGTEDDHKCIECANSYFFSEPTKCISVLPDGFYVDPGDNTMKECHSNCQTCNAAGTDSNTNCLDCKNSSTNSSEQFYPNPIKPSHCQNEDIDGYYLDQVNKQYVKCYETCATCNSGENQDLHNCLACKDGFKQDKKTIDSEVINCVEHCNRSAQYSYEADNNTIICQDNPKCPTEYPVYIPDRNECSKTCKYNYYLTVDKNNSTQQICISSCQLNNQYNYIDNGIKICVDSCLSIGMVTIEDKKTCESTCPDGKYINNQTSQCVSECPDALFIKDKRCIEKCESFYIGANDSFPKQCLNECPFDYYIKEDKQCVRNCPVVVDLETKKCLTNCGNMYIVETFGVKECISKCPKPLIDSKVNMICVVNCGDFYFDDETNSCNTTCPNGKPKDEENKACLDGCPNGFVVNQTQSCEEIICLDNEYFVPTMNKCESDCRNLDMYFDKESQVCVDECPDSYVINKITKVCMTQDDLDQELSERIQDLDNNIKDLAEHYPSIEQKDQIFKIYNSTDLGKDDANIPIHLGECEVILKQLYIIPIDEPLLIIRFEPPNDPYEFLVYSQDGRRLDLKYCSSFPIIVQPPVSSTDHPNYINGTKYHDMNINIFDKDDPFFNDICYSEWINNGNEDIPLHERRKQYISKSSLCYDNCSIKSIDYASNKVKCDCAIIQIHFEFPQPINFWNHELAKCYKLVFKLDNFWLNIGFLLFLSLSIIQFILICVFANHKFGSLMIYLSNLHHFLLITNQTSIKSNPPKVSLSLSKIKTNQSFNFTGETSSMNQESNFPYLNQHVQKALIKRYTLTNKDLLGHEQLNDMDYLLARIYETRSFSILLKYYCLRTQPFINTFCIPSRKRLKTIRVSLFFLGIAIDLFFNTIFYTDDYVGNKTSDFFLKKTIYASLVGMILKKLITFIPSTVYHFRKFYYEKDSKELMTKAANFFDCYKYFICVYFILSSVLLLGFWYYVTAFCGVYPYSQYNWLIGSVTSISLANLCPFVFALILTIMRSLSLKYKLKWLYELQIIVSPFY